MNSKRSTGIDLFCGLGGLSLGMQRAGITPVLGVDVWPAAVAAYQANFPRAAVAEGDLADKRFQDDLIRAWRGKARFVVGGVPCQSFSRRNIVNREGSELPFHFVRIATALDPEYVVMEEVANITTMVHPKTGKSYAETIADAFRRRGYSADYRVLNAADHGVAQSRRRLFLVARKGKHAAPFPELVKRPRIPVSRVISPPYTPITDYANEMAKRPGKRMGYNVMDLDKPSPTVTTEFRNPGTWYVIPVEGGRFALIGMKNGLRVQGFPASWKLTPNLTTNRILIGNAVPPPMAKAVLAPLV